MEALREADSPQPWGELLPLPGALSFSSSLAAAVKANRFRRVARSVRRVVEHVGHCARLTGGTSGGDGRRPCLSRVARGRVSCKRSSATCRHREFAAFPRAYCCDRCARAVITRSLFLKDGQGTLGAARRPPGDRAMDRRLRVGPLGLGLLAHASIVSGIRSRTITQRGLVEKVRAHVLEVAQHWSAPTAGETNRRMTSPHGRVTFLRAFPPRRSVARSVRRAARSTLRRRR